MCLCSCVSEYDIVDFSTWQSLFSEFCNAFVFYKYNKYQPIDTEATFTLGIIGTSVEEEHTANGLLTIHDVSLHG